MQYACAACCVETGMATARLRGPLARSRKAQVNQMPAWLRQLQTFAAIHILAAEWRIASLPWHQQSHRQAQAEPSTSATARTGSSCCMEHYATAGVCSSKKLEQTCCPLLCSENRYSCLLAGKLLNGASVLPCSLRHRCSEYLSKAAYCNQNRVRLATSRLTCRLVVAFDVDCDALPCVGDFLVDPTPTHRPQSCTMVTGARDSICYEKSGYVDQ